MSQDMITNDSQEVFTITESTTTFTETGNTVQNVTITIGDTTYKLCKHSNSKCETVGIHNIGETPITVYRSKLSKKLTKLSCGTSWTVLEKVA